MKYVRKDYSEPFDIASSMKSISSKPILNHSNILSISTIFFAYFSSKKPGNCREQFYHIPIVFPYRKIYQLCRIFKEIFQHTVTEFMKLFCFANLKKICTLCPFSFHFLLPFHKVVRFIFIFALGRVYFPVSRCTIDCPTKSVTKK